MTVAGPLGGDLGDLLFRVQCELDPGTADELTRAIEAALGNAEREAAAATLSDAIARIGWVAQANRRSAVRLGLDQAIAILREMSGVTSE